MSITQPSILFRMRVPTRVPHSLIYSRDIRFTTCEPPFLEIFLLKPPGLSLLSSNPRITSMDRSSTLQKASQRQKRCRSYTLSSLAVVKFIQRRKNVARSPGGLWGNLLNRGLAELHPRPSCLPYKAVDTAVQVRG